MLLTCVAFRQQLSRIHAGDDGPAGVRPGNKPPAARLFESVTGTSEGPSHTQKGRGERAAALLIMHWDSEGKPYCPSIELRAFSTEADTGSREENGPSKSFGSDSIRTENTLERDPNTEGRASEKCLAVLREDHAQSKS